VGFYFIHVRRENPGISTYGAEWGTPITAKCGNDACRLQKEVPRWRSKHHTFESTLDSIDALKNIEIITPSLDNLYPEESTKIGLSGSVIYPNFEYSHPGLKRCSIACRYIPFTDLGFRRLLT
jgi:hypothetical protein